MKHRKMFILTPMKLALLIAIAVIFIIIMIVTIVINSRSSNKIKKTYLNTSWEYSYADMEDLTIQSDVIALIKVQSIADSGTQDGIPFTIYHAQVEKAIYGCSDEDQLKIYMTGLADKESIQEVIDDPLLVEGDEFLIFARINNDDTCTILSGPQGRLQYKDGKVSSLNYIYKNVKNSHDFLPIDVNKKDIKYIIDEIKVFTSKKEVANEEVLKDFTFEHVKAVEMYAEPNIKITLSDQQLHEFLTIFHKVKILNKSFYHILCGQMIRFTFAMKDNSTNIVQMTNPYAIVNRIWYEVDYDPCEEINQFANKIITESKK